MSRISEKIALARANAGITFTQQKLFIPVGCEVPTTAKDSMARIMLQSGLISRDEFDKMLGVTFDVKGDSAYPEFEKGFQDDDFDFDDFDDGFQQSKLAEFLDEFDPEPVQHQPLSRADVSATVEDRLASEGNTPAASGDSSSSNASDDTSLSGNGKGV